LLTLLDEAKPLRLQLFDQSPFLHGQGVTLSVYAYSNFYTRHSLNAQNARIQSWTCPTNLSAEIFVQMLIQDCCP
jgi:hypothetical protein